MFWPQHVSFFFFFFVSLLIQESGEETRAGEMESNSLCYRLISSMMASVWVTVSSFQSILHLYLMWSQQPVDRGRTGFVSWGAKAATISASHIFHIMIQIGKWKNVQVYIHTYIYVHIHIIHISISVSVYIYIGIYFTPEKGWGFWHQSWWAQRFWMPWPGYSKH